MNQLFLLGCLWIVVAAAFGTQQRIRATGRISCCYKRSVDNGIRVKRDFDHHAYICSTPERSTIQLYDHYQVLADELLLTEEIGQQSSYSILWERKQYFDVDPYIKVHIECTDGTILEEMSDVLQENLSNIVQHFEILIPQKLST